MGLRTFTFGGVSSSTYDLFIMEAAPYNAPKRAVEMISIPGRNGAYALDQGHFENIEVKYKVCVSKATQATFQSEISNVRNWLCSKVGYQRLTDDYNPNEYRMAIYKSGLETDQAFLNGAEFDITFECKPQRWLTSGETATAVTSGGTLSNPTLFASRPQLQVWGYGDIGIGAESLTVKNVSIGNVLIASSQSIGFEPKYQNLTLPITLDVSTLNAADNIVVSEIKATSFYETNSGFFVTGSGVVIGTTTNATVTSTMAGPRKYYTSITVGNITFSKGTSSTNSATVAQTINYTLGGSSYSVSTVTTIATAYDGNETITISMSTTNISSGDEVSYRFSATSSDIYGNSTKTALGTPLYIDLDIGECYNLDSGTAVSVNDAVSLPPELPTLPSGNTTITYDNTFTKVDIVPRWWKV